MPPPASYIAISAAARGLHGELLRPHLHCSNRPSCELPYRPPNLPSSVLPLHPCQSASTAEPHRRRRHCHADELPPTTPGSTEDT